MESSSGAESQENVSSRTLNRQVAYMGMLLVAMSGLGVGLGVTLTRRGGDEPGDFPVNAVIGDQIPLLVYESWSQPGCTGTSSLTHRVSHWFIVMLLSP